MAGQVGKPPGGALAVTQAASGTGARVRWLRFAPNWVRSVMARACGRHAPGRRVAHDPALEPAARDRARFRRMRAASVLLPLLGLALAGGWSWIDVAAQLRGTLRQRMTLLHAQTLRTLDVQEAELAAIDAATANLSWPEIRASRLVHGLLVRLADAADAVDTVGLVSPDGRIAAASDLPFPAPPIDLSDRDYVAAFPPGTHAATAFMGKAVLSRVDGRPQVHLGRPRMPAFADSGDGGVIVAGFRPALFEDLFAQVADGGRGAMLLLRDDGQVLARFPEPVAPGQLRPLPPSDPVRVAARALPPGDALALDDNQLEAVQHIGDYGLLLAVTLDPALASAAWLRQMVFPLVGAITSAALLLLLARRTQTRFEDAAEQMRQRSDRMEAERAAAEERARLEARLRQTEKQAALGQLAAGVAHDFNNLLQTVMIGAEAMQRAPVTPERISGSTQLILHAAERGIALTRRMLDYARVGRPGDAEPSDGGMRVIERFDPLAALHDAEKMLSRLLGAGWPVTLRLPPHALPPARGNAAECEAVLLNLAVNARDAMPGGGAIIMEAALAGPPAMLATAAAAAFVRIAVRDGGCGMDEATLARAGEAFFTTKPRGAGTGLGLSMARGFARRAGGTLEIASTPGQGTDVTLWLAAG